jgi:hypothetical protein
MNLIKLTLANELLPIIIVAENVTGMAFSEKANATAVFSVSGTFLVTEVLVSITNKLKGDKDATTGK